MPRHLRPPRSRAARGVRYSRCVRIHFTRPFVRTARRASALLVLALAAAPAPPGTPALRGLANAAPQDSSSRRPSIFFPGPRAPADTSRAARRARSREKLVLGAALERAHEPGAAIAAYRSAVALDPTVPDANYRMGMLFLTVNQVRPAAECFVQEVKHHPENLEAARQLGLAFARLGESRAAVLQLEPLTRRDPRDAESWAALGFAYAGAGRPGAADSALRRAIALRPRVSTWHRDRGVVLAARGRGAAARREYQLAARLDPRDASPWIDLGNLERRDRRFEAALAAYRTAEKRDSLSPLALEGEAKTLRELHRDRDAGAVYRRWLARRPEDHNARLDAVRLYDDLGEADAGLEIARDGVRADPGSPDAHLILGMALQSSGDWRGGLAELRRAEAAFTAPEDRARVRALIGSMRGQAPDALRAFFAADSVTHPIRDLLDSPPGKPRGRR